MKAKPRAYLSRNWKISTPQAVVSLFWQITHQHKDFFDDILDLGAGDGRFARGGNYRKYVGVEIDEKTNASWAPSNRRSFSHGCVFEHSQNNYSACVGNPPYLRHNEISIGWRGKILSRICNQLGLVLDTRSNLYLYFISLGLLKTSSTGLVSLVIPYEWTFIPSASPLRDYIGKNKWNVHIYRLNYPVYEGVLTTASISIVDKSKLTGDWKYFNVDTKGKIAEVKSFTDDGKPALTHEARGFIWGLRGLSPGTKKIFTLSETERVSRGLTKRDVRPCVTTLRELPENLQILDEYTFYKYFVLKNKKCWLIRTDKQLTSRLKSYVKAIPADQRKTWTCLNQQPWYNYKAHAVPKVLMSSAFKKSGPRILLNKIKAIAVGSVIGIHTHSKNNLHYIHNHLLRFDFNSKVISLNNGLKKIAIGQLNAALNQLTKAMNGR